MPELASLGDVNAALARAHAGVDALLAPAGFERTRKTLWVQRRADTAAFVFVQRDGAGRARIRNTVRIQLQAGIRVLDSDFPALALNGPDTRDALLALRDARFHLRFNVASGDGEARCQADLARYVTTILLPWFERFAEPSALLQAPARDPTAGLQQHAALGAQDQACLRQALQQGADPARVAASLALLAIKPRG